MGCVADLQVVANVVRRRDAGQRWPHEDAELVPQSNVLEQQIGPATAGGTKDSAQQNDPIRPPENWFRQYINVDGSAEDEKWRRTDGRLAIHGHGHC